MQKLLCMRCLGEGHRAKNCKKNLEAGDIMTAFQNYATSRSSRSQYSCAVFVHATVSGPWPAPEYRWLAYLGSQVTALDLNHPLAQITNWSKSRMRLRAANGEIMAVCGESRVTIRFRGGVCRTTTIYCVEGLNSGAVIGADVLLSRRGFTYPST
jgi:hypothetical protein